MTPEQLKKHLDKLVSSDIKISATIWGAPGIGKSSIVAQVAQQHNLDFVDVRLSQLSPTDLRGLPVPENGLSKWYPPEFLPGKGKGILFLDELNQSPPAMQGIAQQLILDRRVGSYEVPDGWYIWAACNRKEDRAAVFDMPSPLANRFIHFHVEPDFESFKQYAIARGIHEQVIAFLSFRSSLLHKLDPQQPAWPSPRSWEMASQLHHAGIDVASAVGDGTAAEFAAYLKVYENLPDLDAIFSGDSKAIAFPDEPSARYAVTIGLSIRAESATQGYNAFTWLDRVATPEWIQLFALDLFRAMRSRGQMGHLTALVKQDKRLQEFLKDFQELMS